MKLSSKRSVLAASFLLVASPAFAANPSELFVSVEEAPELLVSTEGGPELLPSPRQASCEGDPVTVIDERRGLIVTICGYTEDHCPKDVLFPYVERVVTGTVTVDADGVRYEDTTCLCTCLSRTEIDFLEGTDGAQGGP